MNNLKKKSKINTVKKSRKDKVRFIVEIEYKGTSTFLELSETIVELVVINDINQQITEILDF